MLLQTIITAILREGGLSLWRNYGRGVRDLWPSVTDGEGSILPQNCVTSFMGVPKRSCQETPLMDGAANFCHWKRFVGSAITRPCRKSPWTTRKASRLRQVLGGWGKGTVGCVGQGQILRRRLAGRGCQGGDWVN